MTDNRIDPELVAAFLDGRLDDDARARFLERLVDDADGRRALVESAALKALLDEETGPADGAVTDTAPPAAVRPAEADLDAPANPPSNRWSDRSHLVRWAPLAAAALVVLAISTVLLRRGAQDGPYLIAADRLAGGAALAPPSWSALRGGTGAVAAERRDYRLGATLVRLRTAAAVADTMEAARAHETLRALLSDVPGSTAALGRLGTMQVAAMGPPSIETVDAAAAGLRRLLGASPYFDLGIWTEQLRFALADGGSALDAGRAAAAAADLAARLRPPAAPAELARPLQEAQRILDHGIDDVERDRLDPIVQAIARQAGG